MRAETINHGVKIFGDGTDDTEQSMARRFPCNPTIESSYRVNPLDQFGESIWQLF
jgi:hypothetical protein